MTGNIFPVATYADALPYLRAPYTPELVHGRIVSVPENPHAPCDIGLYVTSETVMSRLNIVCGLNWGVVFEEVVKRPNTRSQQKTVYYMQVRAHVTVFGRTFPDLGEATAEGEAMAEYIARAQAFKRAARWVEVGHCLYSADRIIMWRGGKEDNKLRIPENGDDPHKHPYLDERSERYIRKQYEHWLQNTGERIYGEPLNHLIAAQGRVEVATDPAPPADTQLQRTVDPEPQSTIYPQEVPAPGVIVNPEIAQSARDAGFSETIAHQMTQLARGEEQVGHLTHAQTQTVQGWIADLTSLKIKEETALAAIDFALKRIPDRQVAQTKFTNWIKAKAQATHTAPTASGERPTAGTAGTQTQAQDPHLDPAAQPDSHTAPNGQLVRATFPSSTSEETSKGSPGTHQGAEPLPALEELAQTIAHHGYQHSAVHRLVALSQGEGSERQIAWENLPEDRVREIARLLNCAAHLGWDNARLQQMVMRAHNSAHQNTPAGRYAAFNGYLTHVARDRAAEAARTAA